MKKIIAVVLSLINAALLAVYIKLCPLDIVPVHYGANGAADRYGSKWEMLVIAFVPVLAAVIMWLASLFGKKSAESSQYKIIDRSVWVCILFFIALSWVLAVPALRGEETFNLNGVPYLMMVFGILFCVLGNVFGKLKQNHAFGIRTHATYANAVVWRKTHRLGGYFAVAGGFIMLICGVLCLVFPDISFKFGVWIFIVVAAFIAFVPIIYSEVLYAQMKKRGELEAEQD